MCLHPGTSVHISLQSKPGRHAIFEFMVELYTGWFTKMLKNVERLGGRAKTLSNLGILKIKLTFYLWGLSNFNIHRMLHMDQGSLSTTYKTYCARRGRRSGNLESEIPYSQMISLLGQTTAYTFLSYFRQIIQNVQTCTLKSITKHFLKPTANNNIRYL